MLNKLKAWRAWIAGIVTILALVWTVEGSQPFQSCVKEAKYQIGGQTFKRALANFSTWTGHRKDCVGAFIHQNEGAITALATLFIALFTLTLWRSTDKLWNVTNDTLIHARESSEHQLRPYVNVSGAEYQWSTDFRVTLECTNSGQSPATFFDVGCVGAVRETGDTSGLTIPSDLDYNTWASLGAGCRETVGIRREDCPALVREVMESGGKKRLLILGRVRYGDVFGNEYESEFIYFAAQIDVNRVVKMSRATGRLKTYHKTIGG
jgi:hypothetical protein